MGAPRAVCAALLFVALMAWPESGETSPLFKRRYPTPRLPLNNEMLRRNDDAGPHTPEQIHIAFAGPSAVAVRWVTWPQLDANYWDFLEQFTLSERQDSALFEDQTRAEDAATDEATLAPHLASRKLLAALPSLHNEEAAAVSSLTLGRLRHHHKRHDRDRDAADSATNGSNSAHCRALQAMKLNPAVQWGTNPGEYLHTISGKHACYSTVAYDSGALHGATMGDAEPLPADTTIYYRVGDADRNEWSAERSFVSAPCIGVQSLPYRLGLLGDLGQTEHSASTLEHLCQHDVDSVILAGDLSYADGFHPRWDTWGRLITPLASQMPWMYTQGNHEIEPTSGSPDFLAFTRRFHLPSEPSGSPSPMFYSYEIAGAHVLMLGSYVDFGKNSEQVAWLAKDLAGVDRERTPWVFAVLHAPWYNSNYNHYGEGEEMRRAVEHILYEYGVDVVISGHVHAYERSHHVYDNKLDACGPLYVNVGDGGNHEGLDFDYYDKPEWSAHRDPSYGHGVMDLVNATHAQFSWYRNQDGMKQMGDQAWLIRQPECRKRKNALQSTAGDSSR